MFTKKYCGVCFIQCAVVEEKLVPTLWWRVCSQCHEHPTVSGQEHCRVGAASPFTRTGSVWFLPLLQAQRDHQGDSFLKTWTSKRQLRWSWGSQKNSSGSACKRDRERWESALEIYFEWGKLVFWNLNKSFVTIVLEHFWCTSYFITFDNVNNNKHWQWYKGQSKATNYFLFPY